MDSKNLKKRYIEKVRPKLKELHPNISDLAIPSIEKVVINRGLGEAISNQIGRAHV